MVDNLRQIRFPFLSSPLRPQADATCRLVTILNFQVTASGLYEYQNMRNSSIFFSFVVAEVVLLSLLLVHAAISENARHDTIEEKAALVKTLQLTDLCLFTEARYTRHLSQADLNTPFQDHPLSMEHFPSGSFTQPPYGITERL